MTILNTPWMIYCPDLQGKMVGWMRWLRLGQQIRSHRGLQTINGPSLGLARLMEQNFVTFLWVGTGGGGELKWVETNGHFMKHKTLALQRNTMTKFIKKIWWYITIFSLFMCCYNISLSTKPLSHICSLLFFQPWISFYKYIQRVDFQKYGMQALAHF